MSLFKLLINTVKQSLPRFTIKTENNLKSVLAMDLPVKEVKDNDMIVPDKNKTRFKRRQWEERRDEKRIEAKKTCTEPVERLKRKKMVLMLGYCGVDYYGMQRNPGVKTIEEDLFKALHDAKYILEEDLNNQQNAHFQRSSRTDKGVSAARQVVSMKLPLDVKVEEINKRLPACIRVFAVRRVTKTFNSKGRCNARTYSYTMPTYTFEASLKGDEERKSYRITKEKLDEINEVLGFYKGTKSYHNFTEKKYFQDPSSARYMMKFSVDKVFVDSGMEFAILSVKGQSFMLHQIRKMVGLAIAIVRGHVDKSIMNRVFGKEKVMIPTAPGLGLVLDMVHYDNYDAKFKNTHDDLKWELEEKEVDKFKHEHIYPVIVKGEIEGNSMSEWLEKLVNHSYEPCDDTIEALFNGDKDIDSHVNDNGSDDSLRKGEHADGKLGANADANKSENVDCGKCEHADGKLGANADANKSENIDCGKCENADSNCDGNDKSCGGDFDNEENNRKGNDINVSLTLDNQNKEEIKVVSCEKQSN